MYNGIRSIDHPLIAVADMESSRATYEKLGFNVPPRGSHIEWGTGNWCIMFANDYLELRGILDPERYTLGLEDVLASYGEGLSGIAFGTEGAEISHAKMIENGLEPKPVRYLTRNFEIPEGWLKPKFALCFPHDNDITGLMHVVLCDHLTPELIRKPEYLIHPNDVQSIISATGIIDDIDAVMETQTRLLGADAVRRDGNQLILTTPTGQFIKLMPKAEFEAEYQGLAKQLDDHSSYLTALSLQVGDLNITKATLTTNGVPYVEVGSDAIRVPASSACGVVLEFVAQPTLSVN